MRSPSQIEQRNGIAPGSSSKGFLSKRGSLGFELSDRRLRSSFSFHGEVRQIDLEPFQDQKEAAEQKEYELELIPFVIKVQRAFRMVKFVYKKFGPMLFLDSKMEASYGQIKFREGYEPAKWISFTPDASARRLVKMMDYYWELPKPEVLVTVTGGAQDFSMMPDLHMAFDRGIEDLARSANAWFFTAGSDAGVMKLFGSTFHRRDIRRPLIGVFPLGVTQGHDILMKNRGGVAPYLPKTHGPDANGAPLNPYHTHFLLVDNGTVGKAAWGSEIAFRTRLEIAAASTKGTPIVQLVVQGGAGTLTTVEQAAMAGMPVVVLADSGGAATAIYDYIMGGIEDVEEKFKAKEGQFSQIKQLNDAHNKSQIQFFSLKGGHYGSSDLSSCLLKSIIDMMNTIPKSEEFPEGSTARASDGGGITRDAEMDKQDRELRRTLGLTVTWDAPNLAHMILANMHTLTKADNKEIGTLRTVGVTLQLALEMQRAKIVKLLCELPGFTVQSINMGRLYSTKDEAGFLTNHKQLQDKIHTYRRDMFAPDKKKMHYVLYQKAVQRFMYNINPILLRLLRQNSVTQVHDVFFWLVCQGNEEMARAMWAKCVMPVHIALLGAAIATSKAGALAEPAKTSALELSLTLQTWAYGLLDIADQAHATKILELEVCESFIRPNTCMDVAMATGAKMFLTQRHCVRLMDCHWRGGIPGSSITISPQFNYVALTLYAVLPPLNPYLWKMTEKKREQRKAAKNATRSDSVIDAIGMVFRVLGEGRTTERVHNEARRMHKAESTMFQIKSLWVTDLFGPSAGQHQQAEEDTHQTTKIMSFYSAPVVKFTLRFLVHAANCALYIALVLAFQGPDELASKKAACDELDDPRPCLATHMPSMFDGNVTEVMWLIFEFGLFSDFKHQSLQRIRKRLPAKIGVGRLAYLSDLFVVVSFSLRLYQELEMTKLKEADFGGNADDVIENARTIYQVYEIVISLKLMLMFFQVLPFLIIYRPLGVLTIMVQQMAQDIINWGLLFLVILGAYMMAFCGLQYAGGFNPELGENRDLRFFSAKYDIYAKDGPFAAPAFAVFGDFSINQYSGVGAIFLWSYLFISSVIMVNLLIAMFSDTFNRVKDSANEEYVHMFFDRVQEHRHVLLAPPPVLNLPYVWFDLLRYFTRSCWERSCLPNCHWMVHADRKKDAAMDILHAPKSSTSATPFTGRHSPEGSQTTQGEATESFEPEPSESLFEDSTRQSRHEEVMDSADTHTNVYDGRTLTDLYLQQKETLDSQTLAARAAHMSEAMDEAKRNHSEAFSKLESKLNKLELWMEDDKFQRETKVDPQTHDQTARIRRIEVCLDKVMQALNIQDHVAEVAPISAPNRRRRRRAPGLGSIVAASSPLPEAEQSAVVVSNFYSRRQTAAPAPFGM